MRKLLVLLAFLAATLSPALAQDKTVSLTSAPVAAPSALTDEQKAAVVDLIKTTLVKDHPEIIMEAMQELRDRDQASAEAKTQDAIKANKAKIYNDPTTPVGGNPKGDVTIVEFGDFNCGYCKMSEPFLESIVKDDKNVRLIYKDFPILGAPSITASKAALAVFKDGGAVAYYKLHDALFAKKEHLTNDDMVYDIVKSTGSNVDKIKKIAASDEIQKQIDGNLELGTAVGVRGTPMFIIGDRVYPGALQEDQLKKAISDARADAAGKKN